MRTDSMCCMLWPGLARWQVVVVDRVNGSEYPMSTVRFRYQRSAAQWVRWAKRIWARRGDPNVQFGIRPLP